jgi:beta-lactam-binding protein with PASTA domain
MVRNYLKLLLYFFVFTALGAAGAYLLFENTGFGKSGEVPSLVGRSITEATELLTKRKLSLHIEGQEYHNEISEGRIVRQLIGPGAKVRAGSRIGVIVSRGKDQKNGQGMFSMPSFEDQILNEAKLTLANLDVRLGKITWVHSDTVEKGKIIAQRPLPGSVGGNEINFLVSLGPYDIMYRCPPFVNMTIEEARILSEKLGIKLIEQNEGAKVVSQKPQEGEIIRKGDAVEVSLGRGRWSWF